MKLEYRAGSSLQTLTRYSHLTQTTIAVKTDFVQDSAGRLASLTHSRPAPVGSLPVSYTYKYFADGRVLAEVSSADGTTAQTYDAFGQVTAITRTAGTNESFAWDKTGNRIVGTTVVGKANRVQSDGTFAYLYDAEGNLTRKTASATSQTHFVTAGERLIVSVARRNLETEDPPTIPPLMREICIRGTQSRSMVKDETPVFPGFRRASETRKDTYTNSEAEGRGFDPRPGQ